MFSFFRISAFRGSRYVFIFVSNHIAVSHSLLPVIAVTFNRPQPSSCHLRFSLIFFADSGGSETKCHPAGEPCFQTFEINSYLIPFLFIGTAEISDCLVKCFRHLQVDNMSAAWNDLKACIGNILFEFLRNI